MGTFQVDTFGNVSAIIVGKFFATYGNFEKCLIDYNYTEYKLAI